MSHARNPEKYINFSSKDWRVLREYLQSQRESIVDRLCGEITNDEANRLRGELRQVKAILSLEEQAAFDLVSAASYQQGA